MKHLLLVTALLCSTNFVFAQLQIEVANEPLEINSALKALFGFGVNIENVQVHCGEDGFGSFEASNFLVEEGIILATGPATSAASSNNSSATGAPLNTEIDGFAPLDAIAAGAGVSLQDYCYIEFDITALGNQFEFNYIFASEEYPEYVCSQYNDLMGIFLTSENDETMCELFSLVPGTEYPVMIGTINNGSTYINAENPCEGYPGLMTPANSEYFIDNYYGENGLYQDIFTYDGLTTVLPAVAVVNPYETYHIKMGVADAGDAIWDSAILVEHGSFYSDGLILDIEIPDEQIETNSDDIPVVSANSSATIVFDIGNHPPNGGEIKLVFEGSAVNGTHFEYIDETMPLNPEKNNPFITVSPIEENLVGETLDLKIRAVQLITPSHHFNINHSIDLIVYGDYGQNNSVSIGNINENSVQLYPNPASDVLTISLNKPMDNATHKIYNVKGQQVMSFKNDGDYTSINISHLNNGIYWYELAGENGVIERQKLIVIH